ncbi:MAG TPA: serine/threonine-protein kinase [Anaerolineales bacterium]|nr:serine/threonine-protein kinase [Anaerolineales bacterium]
MSFNVGENIGPYRIVEQLGQGGMATVFKAYHASLDRYVALKALHPALNTDQSFASRFQREARVVARLEHPNIVPVYDYAEHETRPYLVMKFIEGDTLKARMDQGPLASEEIAKIVEAVGAALAYAHKQGVLHRDVKPSNVLLASDGNIYLADFGLARMAQSGESTLSSDMVMGTPQYISPEQAMGKSDLDQRTDLYSFGVMLYEMVVGRVPFNADTPFAIIHDHIYSPLPLPHKVNPNVPEQVERVLLKSLAKERSDRFENASQLVSAFKEAWNEAGIPMQGTFIRVSQAIQPVEKTNMPAQQVAPAAAVALSEPAQGAAQAKVSDAGLGAAPRRVEPSKTKRSPWVWVSAGLIILLCMGLFAFARNNRLFGRFLAGLSNRTPVVAATQIQPPGPTQPVQTALLPPPITPPNAAIPPEVMEAQKRADKNPRDPNAQLELALAFWNANLPRQTYEILGKVFNIVDPHDRDFFMQAGDKFKSQQDGWLPAASMYFQAERAFASGDIPNHVTEAFHEALYKAANRPEFIQVVPVDEVRQIDEPILLVAQSRNAYFHGRIDDSVILLMKAREIEDTLREADLLEGEMNALEGKKDLATLYLGSLMKDTSSTPEWIRLYAKQLLDGMK